MRLSVNALVIAAIVLVAALVLAAAYVPGPALRTAASWFAVYFVIWWLVLFAVLPMGVKSQAESGEVVRGTDPGAPVVAGMGQKIVWTTVIAGVAFAAFYFASPWLLPD